MNPNTQTQVKQKLPAIGPNQVNIGTADAPNIVSAVTPMTPKVQTTPISASIIGQTTPLAIPQVNSTAARDGLGAAVAIASQPENTAIIETNPDAQPVQDAPTSTDLRSRLAKLIGVQSGEGAKTTALQNEFGLSDKQFRLNEINKQITTTAKGYDDQIKNLSKNGTGYNGGNQTAIADLTRQKNEDLANLAIIQSGANGDLSTAQSIIDSKIKAEFEPVKNEIASLTQLYNLTQNDLSESEKLQIQTKIDEKKTTAQNLMQAKSQAYQTALQNGAPASILKSIGEATTPEAAYSSVGSYGRDALDVAYKQAQISNIYSNIAKDRADGENTLNGKPQTATQSSANSYANRLAEANVTLDLIGEKFTKPQGLLSGVLPNILKSGDRQAYEQSVNNFVTAVLRRESGAAISPTEFSTAEKLYFPQPGDKPEIVLKKAETRNGVINNFYKEANVQRPTLPGQIVEKNGKRYQINQNGQAVEL